MKELDYKRFIFPVIFLVVMMAIRIIFKDMITFDYGLYLIIIGGITLINSFDFIHTQLGQNASRTNIFNEYTHISNDMKYYSGSDRGYTLEHLLCAVIEIIIGLIIHLT